MTSIWMVQRLAMLWLAALLLCTLLAHGLRAEYLPIEAATAGVWVALLGSGALLANRLAGQGRPRTAVALLSLAALLACEVAVVVDSALIYDVAGYWTLDGGAGLPYSYSPLWYPAAVLPSPVDVLGIDQAAITAGDFEWQQEHVTPVATVLTIASAIFVVPAAMVLLGLRRPWLARAVGRTGRLGA